MSFIPTLLKDVVTLMKIKQLYRLSSTNGLMRGIMHLLTDRNLASLFVCGFGETVDADVTFNS